MEISSAVQGLACTECDGTVTPAETPPRCPDCGGVLRVTYDLDSVSLSGASLAEERFDGIARYERLLPFDRSALVTGDEGTTPLVDCPSLADELGVETVTVKDEGANPTGSVADRGLAVAVTAAAAVDATDVALPTTGAAGYSAAAYAARAGLDSHSFVPSRAVFGHKAMINVHGGDMSVVGGRYGDATEAFAEDADDEWYPVDATNPYRVEGAKTLAYELAEQTDFDCPDAVVYPTGEGVGLVGLGRGFDELAELGLVDDRPALYAAQAAECAPIAEAYEDGADDTAVWEVPDTICGGIEVADPPLGGQALAAVRETGGAAVGTSDGDAMESAVAVADAEGVGMAASAGPAASGAWELAEDGAFDDHESVALVNTMAASVEADVLRSHLMSKGI